MLPYFADEVSFDLVAGGLNNKLAFHPTRFACGGVYDS